jgi:hypothetical protein
MRKIEQAVGHAPDGSKSRAATRAVEATPLVVGLRAR